jgi:hypothetical protein
MKAKCLVIIWLLGFLSVVSCNATDLNPVKILKVNEPQIEQALNQICNKDWQPCGIKLEIFIIKVSQWRDSCTVIISRIHREDVTKYLRNKKDSLLGTFSFNSQPVLVFGDKIEFFFTETTEKIMLDFLNIKAPKIKKGAHLTTFEPMVWIYNFHNSQMILRKGRHI